MEGNSKIVESLMEDTTAFIKLNIELAKLKALQKIADLVSSLLPHTLVFLLLSAFVLFVNLGLALWIGALLGEVFYGFFVVAGFYLVLGVVIRFIFLKSIKKSMANKIVHQLSK
jgi:hypothetical protein